MLYIHMRARTTADYSSRRHGLLPITSRLLPAELPPPAATYFDIFVYFATRYFDHFAMLIYYAMTTRKNTGRPRPLTKKRQ